MDPERRRRRRFTLSLSVAVILAAALVYTSVSASSEARSPSQLLGAAQAGRSYELTGRVLPGYTQHGAAMDFRVSDRAGGRAVLVHYTGEVPDPFKAGREVIVTVRRAGNRFVGEHDSLITKCPSKFSDAKPS
jgi:cytochrome c-type biogenesis protein CcmE